MTSTVEMSVEEFSGGGIAMEVVVEAARRTTDIE
jgi:hypothetical protein